MRPLKVCPAATQNVAVNLKNRKTAIEVADYGPANPMRPNSEYWQRLADIWGISPSEARTMRCGNCAAFDVRPEMLECIQRGIGVDDQQHVIQAGRLGYCHAFKFKCASARTCSAWIVGGPIQR
jgi:hypothetical protein